jgi:hypothetical protein
MQTLRCDCGHAQCAANFPGQPGTCGKHATVQIKAAGSRRYLCDDCIVFCGIDLAESDWRLIR